MDDHPLSGKSVSIWWSHHELWELKSGSGNLSFDGIQIRENKSINIFCTLWYQWSANGCGAMVFKFVFPNLILHIFVPFEYCLCPEKRMAKGIQEPFRSQQFTLRETGGAGAGERASEAERKDKYWWKSRFLRLNYLCTLFSSLPLLFLLRTGLLLPTTTALMLSYRINKNSRNSFYRSLPTFACLIYRSIRILLYIFLRFMFHVRRFPSALVMFSSCSAMIYG